ncbi:MAG: transglutaminase-like domain-containing protein [Candidatus Micrarchaeota archaeon]
MSFCSACGKQLLKRVEFCPKCGAKQVKKESGKGVSKWLIFSTLIFLLCVLFSCLIFSGAFSAILSWSFTEPSNQTIPTQPMKTTYTCPDGTIANDSTNCPKICSDGTAVTNLANCPPQKCDDGTVYGACSTEKPKYCRNGLLIFNATLCGCPEGQELFYTQCVPHGPPCSDGTLSYKCSLTKPKFCYAGTLIDASTLCGCPVGREIVDNGCSASSDGETTNNTFTSYEDAAPYYGMYCDKINPYDLDVRTAASKAIKDHPGSYSADQLFDIYDWVKENIYYQNVPLAGIPYPPSETLLTESGDCKNQAVLIASMIKSIGGTAKVVVDPDCEHAYTLVYFGKTASNMSFFSDAVANHYGSSVTINYITSKDGVWIIFDPAGGVYPGNTLSECSGDRTIYYVTSCMNCVQQYPKMPYTYGDSCYSECPYGTTAVNEYACG